MGYPYPSQVRTGKGVPQDRVPHPLARSGWGRGYSPDSQDGGRYPRMGKGYPPGQGRYPLAVDGHTPVKTLPSRRTTYAGVISILLGQFPFPK